MSGAARRTYGMSASAPARPATSARPAPSVAATGPRTAPSTGSTSTKRKGRLRASRSGGGGILGMRSAETSRLRVVTGIMLSICRSRMASPVCRARTAWIASTPAASATNHGESAPAVRATSSSAMVSRAAKRSVVPRCTLPSSSGSGRAACGATHSMAYEATAATPNSNGAGQSAATSSNG
ncbi:hypothetical protein [Nonomuraea sp. KM90]|uniref:hypothetical protein n=1 Tax=Nonomuraea sp. KM90 TaxID=3457428 RepID=UPI003FCCAD92